MSTSQQEWLNKFCRPCAPEESEAFSRMDETEDSIFYSTDRFVSHLDKTALNTVEKIIGELVIEDEPVILDLMAGWDSHIPDTAALGKTIGLGLNKNELEQNKALDNYVIHDINTDPDLPFEDNSFDVVLNTVSVDYLTRPLDVFKEVGRVLKPGGLFLVVFSNRMFHKKVVNIWRRSSEDERVLMVEDFFRESGLFEPTNTFRSMGLPRPSDDKYAEYGMPSDPIYAVYAEKKGGDPDRKARPGVKPMYGERLSTEELACRMTKVKDDHCCPYCGEKMNKWAVPDSPFGQTWDNDFMYICFNDGCPYFVRGYSVVSSTVGRNSSYRFMYNPEKDCCLPIPAPTPKALKEGIID